MKKFNTVLAFGAVLFLTVPLFSCSINSNDTPIDEPTSIIQEDWQLEAIFNLVQKSGFEGTYEQWLESIKGKDGVGIKSFELISSNNDVDIYRLTFTDGTYQDIKVTNGKDGEDGKSAYEIYKEQHPDYPGSESEWIEDLINGRLAQYNKYTVSFNTNGGTAINNQIVPYLGKIKKPTDPIRQGSTLKYWEYKNEPWNFDTCVVSENMVLDAIWSDDYKIFIDKNNDGVEESVQFVRSNNNFKLPDLSVENEKFLGWKYLNNLITDNHGNSLFEFNFNEDIMVTPSYVDANQPSLIKEPTTIEFWHTFSYTDIINKFINDFNKIEPNVTVINKSISGSYSDLKESTIEGLKTNNYPDLVSAYPDHVVEYFEYNKVAKLDEYINHPIYGWSNEDKEDLIPSFLREGRDYALPGTYSLPMAKSSEGMFYNENLLNLDLKDPKVNAGQPIDKDYLNNLTWEHFFDVLCPALVNYNASLPESGKLFLEDLPHHGILGINSEDNLFINLATQYGYGYTAINNAGQAELLFDNPGMKSLMKKFNEAYKKGYIITTKTCGGKHPNDFFVKQNCLFSIGSTGGIKYQLSDLFNVGVAKVPHAEGNNPYVISQGPSVALLSHDNSNRELASWLFYKFMTNKENALTWALKTGYMPIRFSCYENQRYIKNADSNGKVDNSIERLSALTAQYIPSILYDMYTTPAFKGSSEARHQVSMLMSNSLMQPDLTDEWLNVEFTKTVDNIKLAM